jgi:hypothetical protein
VALIAWATGFLIVVTVRALAWCGRSLVRGVIRHPGAALVAVVVAAGAGWLSETVAAWALLALTIWGALSVASTRFPNAARASAPRRDARVSVNNGPWQARVYRDPLDHVSARDRARFERARRRHEKRLTKAAGR